MAGGQSNNDLLDQLASDAAFSTVDVGALKAELDPAKYVGRSPEQVIEFLDGPVADLLGRLSQFATNDDVVVRV